MQFQECNKPLLHSFSGPVTALTVFAQKALVGCGNEVSIYCLNILDLEIRIPILHGASIHGFSQGGLDIDGNQLICVYGAKQACVIAIKSDGGTKADLTVVSCIAHLPDWIWEARWVKEMESTSTVAFALAHNTVVLWDWKENRMIRRQDCEEKCILYCANLIGDTWADLVLAAGTVFNQVVLWLVSHNNKDGLECSQSPSPVMHTLSGHKGVIFSIKYHAQHQYLCSVSDDRSIRLWRIDFPNGENSVPSADDWKEMKSSLLLSVFGHSARVFDAVLMNRYFASIGEDATCCIWDYSGQVIMKFKGHKGKSIWSVAATEDEQHILTGGGDGSVRKWKINTGQDNSPIQQILDVSKSLPVEKDDFPRTVTLLDFDRVLIMMNSGSLYCYTTSLRQFDRVFEDIRFTSYSVVSSCPDMLKIAVASIGGVIRIIKLIPGKFQAAPSNEELLFDNKILAVVWISNDRLIVSGQNGICHILQITEEIDVNDSLNLNINIVHESSLSLPMGKHRWISAACMIDIPSELATVLPTKLLACGDKNGTMYSYQISAATGTPCDSTKPSQSFHKIHGKNGVTHVCFLDGILYSVGRDGCCRHWGVEGGQLVLRHGSKVIKGFEWIDRLELESGDLMFYGFFSTQFVIWSQRYNQKMFYVECGGGHRSWGCCHDNGAFRFVYLKGGVVNVVDSAQCSRHEILKPPLHGREVHDVKLLEMVNTHSPSFLTFTASEDTTINIGSFYKINGFMQWKPLAILKGHLSSVRTLAILYESRKKSEEPTATKDLNDVFGSQSDFILFTGGGRAEIRVWKVRVKINADSSDIMCNDPEEVMKTKVECAENCERLTDDLKKDVDPVVCTHQEWSTHYLGESRHKRPFSKWKTRKLNLDPETRVMSLDATSFCDIDKLPCVSESVPTFEEGDDSSVALEHLHIVSAAGSDGLLRVFCYNDEKRKLTLVAQSSFHQGCVLKVLHFHFKSKHDNLFLALSTSTNGKIAVWLMDHIVEQFVVVDREARKSLKSGRNEQYNKTSISSDREKLPQFADSKRAGELTSLGMNEREDDDEEVAKDKTEDFQPLCSLPAHQSGINSIHAFQINEKSFLLASGGDDNAMTVQVIEVKGREVEVLCHATNRNAHSAHITGLRVVSDSLLVSSSIDQRICVWGLDIQSQVGVIKIKLLSCSYIYLADVSCMDVSMNRNGVYLYLGGEGHCLYSWREDLYFDKDKSLNEGPLAVQGK